jgi:hypothetical protein
VGDGLVTVALATVTAVATAALALVAWFTLRENRRLAKATVEQTKASVDQAKASAEQAKASKEQAQASAAMIDEVRTDRALAWKPHVVASWEVAQFPGTTTQPVRLKNIGAGPALSCFYADRHGGRNIRSPMVHIGSGESEVVNAVDHEPEPHLFELIPIGEGHAEWIQIVVECASALGHRYRFGFRFEGSGQLVPFGVEEHRATDPTKGES